MRAYVGWLVKLTVASTVIALALVCPPAKGATLTVSNLNDSGAGSLRGQVAAALTGDTINFSVTGTISLDSGEIAIGKSLLITGPGVMSLTVRQTTAARVFNITAGAVTISGLTITGGNVAGDGGGILNVGTLTVNNSRIEGNAASGNGGGICNNDPGTLTVTNTTFTGNSAGASGSFAGGGAVYSARNSWSWATTLMGNAFLGNTCPAGSGGAIHFTGVGGHNVTNCTFSGNSSPMGAAIRTTAGNTLGGTRMVLTNVTISANTGSVAVNNSGLSTYQNMIASGNPSGDVWNGTGVIQNNCIIGGAPLLGTLGDYGGPTQTYPLLSGSPAINAGAGCPATDQRGVVRPIGAACDIGAFESNLADVSITVTDGVTSRSRGALVSYAIMASNAGPSATTALIADTFAAALAGVGWTCVAAGGATCTASGSGNISDTVSLPAGGSVTYFVDATVSGTASGTVSNTATATLQSAGVADPSVADNSGSDSFLVTVVTSLNDSGAGSLRDTIAGASSGDVIEFDVTGTIVLASELLISKNLSLTGPGASSLTLSGNNAVRVLRTSGGTVGIVGLTIANGDCSAAPVYPGEGGGILAVGTNLTVDSCVISGNVSNNQGGGLVSSGGSVTTIRNSTITGNQAQYGAGLESSGAIVIVSCTISGNTATSGMGGAGLCLVSSGSSADISSTTIANNTAPAAAGISGNWASPTTIRNSIVASNSGGDCGTVAIASAGYNVVGSGCSGWVATDKTGQAANVAPLASNGGPTPTHGLQPGSPAIDAGNPGGCTDNLGATLAADQRGLGYPRVKGSTCDAGAFEASYVSGTLGVTGAAGTVTYTGGSVAADGSTGIYSFTVPQGWTGSITPSKPGYVFAPPSITVAAPVSGALTGQDFTATLCIYSLPLPAQDLGAGASAGQTFTVTANDSGCPAPSASPNAAWITGVTVTGVSTPFTVTYNVASNVGPARVGTITAGGQTFTVNQASGCAANTALVPANASIVWGGSSGQTFQVQVAGGCPWTATSNDPSWLTISGGAAGSGTGPVTYDVAANAGPARVGTITAGGQTFTVNQADGCAANTSLNPVNASVAWAGGTGQTFQVQVAGGCPWTATSNDPSWLTISGGASGSGTGPVTFDVAANVGPARVGTISAGGQTFTVNQADGCAANTTVNPVNAGVAWTGATGQTFQVQVAGGCPWTATSNVPSWLTISGGASGSGTGLVSYDVAVNVGPARIGTITAGGRTFTVNQADGCAANTSLNPTNAGIPWGGASGQTFQIQVAGGCPWTATSNDPSWLTISGGASGSGTGLVTYDVAVNAGPARVGTITAGGQTFTINQAIGCAASTSLVPTSSSVAWDGATGQTFQIQIAGGCTWTATSNDPWITVTGGASGNGTGTVTYNVAANAGPARTGTISAGSQTFTVDQASGCAANTSLVPQNATFAWEGASGQNFQVQVAGGCPWTAVSNDSWISIADGASGSGTGTVIYNVPANVGPARTGTVTAGGRTFTVDQASGCAANTSLVPESTAIDHPAVSGQTFQVQVAAGCLWTAVSNNSWIVLTGSSSGSGAGVVTYDVAANVGLARVGSITAGGRTFTVNQADGCAANTTLAPTSASVGDGGATGLKFQVEVAGGCPWTAAPNTPWLTITSGSSGTGTGSVMYNVAPNPGPVRSGTITAGGQTFTVGQADGCAANTALLPSSATVAAAGASGLAFAVQVAAGCLWSAGANDSWITITAGDSGSGAGTVTYSVLPNAGLPRTGTITAGGQTFTVNQQNGCAENTTLLPSAAALVAAGATGQTFQVQAAAGCAWSVTSNSVWIIITAGISGIGTGTVTYDVAANPGPARTGTVTVGGHTFTVSQSDGCGANITLIPTNSNVPAAGASGQAFQVQVASGCAWTAVSGSDWITVTGAASGMGPGTVSYAVSANGGPARAGSIAVGGRSFTVNQAAGCAGNTTLLPASARVPSSGAHDLTFEVQAVSGCEWSATTGDPWITITAGTPGTGSGQVTYTVAPNTGPFRTGSITVSGKVFAVNQEDGCSSGAALVPSSASLPAAGAEGQSFQVQTGDGCSWTASSSAAWITITAGSPGTGNGTVTFNVAANGGPARTGTITAAGRVFTVEQAAGIPATERAALIALYDNAGGQNWTHNAGWSSSIPGTECTWYGVVCGAPPARPARAEAALPATSVIELDLSNNNLTGPIPAAISGMTSLQLLSLSSNALAGPIPAAIGSLVHLRDQTGLDLRWNSLSTADTALASFLSSKQRGGDWASTQTVAPAGLAVLPVAPDELRVTWTPIAYVSDPGHYEVQVSTVPGGPYSFSGQTSDKSENQLTVTGLNAGSTYYFIVKTVTEPHPQNASRLVSEGSSEIHGTTHPCAYSLTPERASLPAAGAVGQSFRVQTMASCGWTASSNAAWITLSSGTSGTGEGTVVYNVMANSGAERTGTITAAGRVFVISQAPACPIPATPQFTSYPEAPIAAGNSFVLAWAPVLDLPASGYYEVQLSESADCSSPATIATAELAISVTTAADQQQTFCATVRAVAGTNCPPESVSGPSSPVRVQTQFLPASFTVLQGQFPIARVRVNQPPPADSTVVFRNVGSAPGMLHLSTTGDFFSVSPSTLPGIPAGADATVQVRFTSGSTRAPGVKQGDLVGTWQAPGGERSVSTVITLTVLEADSPATAGMKLEPVGSSFVHFRQAAGSNPVPQTVTIRNTGSLPLRIAPSIGPGGSWLLISGDFATPVGAGAERSFDLSVNRALRTTEDGPPPLGTTLRINNVDGAPEDAANFDVFDEEPPAPTDGTNRDEISATEFSLILGAAVSTTSPAGSRRGLNASNGTQYLSDGWIRNRSADLVSVELYFTPDGAGGVTDPNVKKNTLALPGYTAYRLSDFVRGLFGERGSGSVEIRSTQLPQLSIRTSVDSIVTRDGIPFNYGAELPILVTGQGIAAPGTSGAVETLVLTGLLGPLSGSRSNVIFCETAGKPALVDASLYDSSGRKLGEKAVFVDAYSKSQVNHGDPELFPAAYANGTLEVTPRSGEGTVSVFVTILDIGSQSHTVQLGTVVSSAPKSQRKLEATATGFLPFVAQEKTADAFFTTRLSIANTAPSATTLRATYIPDPKYGDPPDPVTVEIPAREPGTDSGPSTVVFQEVLKELLKIEDGSRGMLKFEGELGLLVFSAETSTPLDLENPEKGRSLSTLTPAPGADPKFAGVFSASSQEILGVKLSETDSAKQEVSLPAIEEGPAYRTDLVLAELAGAPARVRVLLRKSGGAALGEPMVIDLEANERRQIERVIVAVTKPPSGTVDLKDIEIVVQAVEGKGRTLALASRIANDPASRRMDTYVLGPAVSSSAKKGKK